MSKATSPEIRNLRFETGSDVPRQWHPAGRAVTLFFNNLSLFFPVGERFFVASVKAHRKLVTDPVLLEDVKGFCGQEGVHGREHVRYNEMLQAQGYPVAAIEARVARLLDRVTERSEPRLRLAVTCALEHFTALMAELLLADDRLLAGAHPVMARLWRWHAAEENEHKAVAFDVYRAAGGTYLERVTVMVGATMIFWAKVVEQQIRMMAADGLASSVSEWASLFRFLFVQPGGLLRIVPLYFQYYRPSFHPWDHDNRALLDAWRDELAASEEYAKVA